METDEIREETPEPPPTTNAETLTPTNRLAAAFLILLGGVSIGLCATKFIRTHSGVNVQGGVRMVLRVRTEDYHNGKWTPDKLTRVHDILWRRAFDTGVPRPIVQTEPPDRFLIELPGVKDTQKAVEELQTMGSLAFYWLPQLGNTNGTRTAIWKVGNVPDPTTGHDQATLIESQTNSPLSEAILREQVFSKEPLASNKDLLPNCAALQLSTQSNGLQFEFNEKAGRAYEAFTGSPEHQGDLLAIYLDGKLLGVTPIQGVMPRKGALALNLSIDDIAALADRLNAGALPAPLELVKIERVAPHR